MNYRIVLTLDADADIGSVFSWYHRIDPNLAARFMSEGRTTMVRIAQFPYRFQLVNGAVRRARLKRFPYGIYYSIDHDEVFITAILHLRRADLSGDSEGTAIADVAFKLIHRVDQLAFTCALAEEHAAERA